MSDVAAQPVRGRWDSWLVLAVALVVYLALGQGTLYGVDGWRLMRSIAADNLDGDMHLLYQPCAVLSRRLGAILGMTALQAVVACSGIGAACGVAAMHGAARTLGLSRDRSLLVAALVGSAPGVLFYATVVERHGPFLAGAGLTAWATAWLAMRPGWPAAVATAIAMTVAYALHSTGFLLGATFLPLSLVWGKSRGSADTARLVRWHVVAGLAAIGGALLARKIGVWTGTVGNEGANLEFFLIHAAGHIDQPALLPLNIAHELLLPFAPMVVLWWAIGRDDRGLCAVTAWSLLAYQALSFAILGGYDECGAYALPLAWPLAVCTAMAWSARVGWGAVLIALAIAVGLVVHHDDRRRAPVAAALRAASAEHSPYLIVATIPDFELIFEEFPDHRLNIDYLDGFEAIHQPSEVIETLMPTIAAVLRATVDSGRPVWIATTTVDELSDPDLGKGSGPTLLAGLRAAFQFEPVSIDSFTGYRLR